jgi:hypothetical protein
MISVLEPALDRVAGAVEAVRGPSGITFPRSSDTARSFLNDIAFDFMSAIPSAVRFELITDAPSLEADAELTKAGVSGMAVSASAFDLVVDGELRPPIVVTEVTHVVYAPATEDVVIERAASAGQPAGGAPSPGSSPSNMPRLWNSSTTRSPCLRSMVAYSRSASSG